MYYGIRSWSSTLTLSMEAVLHSHDTKRLLRHTKFWWRHKPTQKKPQCVQIHETIHSHLKEDSSYNKELFPKKNLTQLVHPSININKEHEINSPCILLFVFLKFSSSCSQAQGKLKHHLFHPHQVYLTIGSSSFQKGCKFINLCKHLSSRRLQVHQHL